jgi:broad specificity phosphatase PhoE
MGRGWHHGKRVDARMRGFTIRAAASDRKNSEFSRLPPKSRKTRVILIRHGQTEFNGIFSVSRQDPGVRDPHLTDQGRPQARAVAQVLPSFNFSRLITRPYARALETDGIIAEHLDLPITGEPLIAERFSFICAIGAPLAELHTCWPDLAFDPLQDPWSSQNGGKRGDGLGTISELPSTDRR